MSVLLGWFPVPGREHGCRDGGGREGMLSRASVSPLSVQEREPMGQLKGSEEVVWGCLANIWGYTARYGRLPFPLGWLFMGNEAGREG